LVQVVLEIHQVPLLRKETLVEMEFQMILLIEKEVGAEAQQTQEPMEQRLAQVMVAMALFRLYRESL
jgi:hypothetical protein